MTIIFIAPNSIKFRDPVYDPVFQATYGDTELSNTGERFTVYSPDYPVSVVGCTEQYAICNPNRKVNNCTSFDGQNALLSNIHSVGLSQDQYVTAVRMVYMIADGTTYSSVDGIGPDALQVWDEVHDFVAPGVPANQWQVEMQGWLETTLSKWQAYMVEYAHNTGSKGAHGHVGYPISNSSLQKIWENQCRNQKISNVGAYQNVSIFGFAFTWATGGMLILLSWVLKFFVKRYDKGSKRKNRPGTIERRVAWNIDGKFQQQRIALQSAGYCGLVGGEDDVPYLEEEAILPLPFHAKEARDDGSTGYVRRSSPSVEQQSINHPAEEAAQPRADDDDGAKIEELLHLTENPDGHAPESLLPPPRPTDIPNGHASEGAVLPPRLDDSSSSTDVNSASPEHVATEGEASLDGRLSSQEEGVHGPSISPATCNQNNGTDHPANDDDPAQVTLG